MFCLPNASENTKLNSFDVNFKSVDLLLFSLVL